MPPFRSETPSSSGTPDPAALLLWYDRHRRALPWRAPAGVRPEPLPRLAQRDHAAADDGSDCRPIFRPIRGTLARCFGARRGIARRDTATLARARLLRARPQPACLRARRRRAAWRQVPRRPGSIARAARDRVLQRGGDRRDRVRSADRGDRRQCRTRRRPALCRARTLSRGKTAPQSARRGTGAGGAGRRFRAGLDGSRRHDLHAAAAALRPLPVARLLRRSRGGPGGRNAGADREAGPAVALRRCVLAHSRRRSGAAAPPPGERLARRHDRNPVDAVAQRTLDTRPGDRVAPAAADWAPLPGTVRHGFTHFRLELAIVAGKARRTGCGARSIASASTPCRP